MSTKIYPIGIQNFEKIRNDGYLYIDKTALMYQMVKTGSYYFLSRPRRFGKSLLISTLEAYFQGKKELFTGLAVERLEKDWIKYPILHLDLNIEKYDTPESLDNILEKSLTAWEKLYGAEPSERSFSLRFAGIIERACKQAGQRVVILVDEYDKPMLQAIGNEKLQKQFRDTLKPFYGALKTMDGYIKFAFLTGVTKFGKVSVFSDLNNLDDISMRKDYDDIADAAIIVITAGANQKPDETRLDLVNKNIAIFQSIIPEITKRDFEGILLIVANPVDILTYTAQKLSGYPEKRVIGSGTVLDSARLKYHLGQHLGVDSRSVHAFIVGEHGDSEIAAWSSANISGIPLDNFCEMRGHYNHMEATERIAAEVKQSAYEIISKKGATYYGIAMSVKRICEAIIRDEKSILPISTMLHGEYGISDVVLSLPCIVGRDGYETKVPIDLDQEEVSKLHESANTLKEVLSKFFAEN